MQADLVERESLSRRLSELAKPVTDLEEGLLVSATYDGEKRVAVLKFYDPRSDVIKLWHDNTGHRPYCYTKLPAETVQEKVKGRTDIVSVDEVQKLDLLTDSNIMVRRIVATDPLAIGGSPGRSLRDEMDCWEADIKYYENYVYDRGLRIGTYYKIVGGNLTPIEKEVPETVKRSLDSILSKTGGEAASHIKNWAELLGQPVTAFKRIACDIEVANEQNRIPDPEKADRKIIAVSFHNGTESLAYLVQRSGDNSMSDAKMEYTPVVFPDEPTMLRATFAKMMDYPFLITFNGDDFDLRYLKHRAERLGIREEEIPIALQRQEASLKHGVHIDLYRFFNNRSIQIYVYGNRYSEHTLNGISEALLDKSKIEFDGDIGELPMRELADYCLNDSQITYELTSANDSLLMKILLVISRIAKMPMNDVARLGVSNWIRSMLFYEHRRMGALIPRSEELRQKGGASSEAIIKGKKYKGGLVIEPKPGIHFGVSVMDFASLYPSIIKVHNLSYETVNCGHEECKRNKVPDTDHWVCEKRSGIESLVTGSLRDLRVSHYKQLARSQSLSKEDRDLNNTVSQGLKVILNACFTGDTEIVTPEGIRNIKDIKVGDKVINVNPETLRVELDNVIEIQEFPYRGEMYHFKDRRFVDLQVTPNHRFLVKDVRTSSKTGAMFRTAQEVFNATNMAIPKLKGGIDLPRTPGRISLLATAQKLGAVANLFPSTGLRLSSWFAQLPSVQKQKIRKWGRVDKNRSKVVVSLRSHYKISASVLTEDDIDEIERVGGFVLLGMPRSSKVPARYDSAGFASFCGWFVSEGNLIENEPKFYPDGGHRGLSSGIVISQSFGKGNALGGPYRSEIGDLLGKLGIHHVTDSGDKKYFRVSNRIIHEWMRENCYVGSPNYHASSKRMPRFVFSSLTNMESFFDSCYKGDGSSRNRMYSTSSIQLAKDMVVVLSLLGAKSKIKYEKTDRIYRVVFRKVSSKLTYSGPIRHRYVKKFEYEGTVYCVTAEHNHTVIAGRNGHFVPVGQSYGVMGFETFALYCLPVAEATAAFGRYSITKTIEKCRELGIDVIYSDSLTGERCVTVMDPNGAMKVEPVEALFNRFSDVWNRDDGKKEVHPVGWKALSLNRETGKTDWKELNAIIRHRSDKRIYRVWDKFGSTRVTEDHSLVVSKGKKRVLSKPQDLAGKHLLRVGRIPRSSQIEVIDLYEVLEPIKYRVLYKRRWKILQAHCDNEWVWYSWTNRKNPIKLRRYVRAGTPEFIALVELLGAYIPEGSSSTPDTSKSRMGASIACSDTNWLERQRENHNKLFFNATSSVIRSNQGLRNLNYRSSSGEIVQVEYTDNTHKLQMMNKVSAVFFKAFCGQTSGGKRLPDFIFNVPKQYKLLMLENMVKGDGSRAFSEAYSEEYKSRNFKYETKSVRLISGLSTLLMQLGINHTIAYRQSKDSYAIATSTNYNRTRRAPRVVEEKYDGDVYDLSVEGNHTFVDSCGNIVLKNTDSLFLNNPTAEKIRTVAEWAEKELGVELDLDKTYRYVAFSERKKNYFGVLNDGTPDIKGLTGKKSMTPEFLKKTFYESLEILGKVYGPQDFERAKASIRLLLTGAVAKLRNKEVPLDELSFKVMMGKSTMGYGVRQRDERTSKSVTGETDGKLGETAGPGFADSTPQHVKAAIQLEKTGREMKAGDIISYVKTRYPPYVKPTGLARQDDIDVDRYLEYARSMFDQILDGLGFNFEEIMGGTTLDLFWS